MAIQILMMLDGWQKGLEEKLAEIFQVKLAAVASGKFEVSAIFPEYTSTSEEEQSGMGDNPETAYDYRGVEYEPVSGDEYERLMAELENSTVSVEGVEAGEDEDDEEREWL